MKKYLTLWNTVSIYSLTPSITWILPFVQFTQLKCLGRTVRNQLILFLAFWLFNILVEYKLGWIDSANSSPLLLPYTNLMNSWKMFRLVPQAQVFLANLHNQMLSYQTLVAVYLCCDSSCASLKLIVTLLVTCNESLCKKSVSYKSGLKYDWKPKRILKKRIQRTVGKFYPFVHFLCHAHRKDKNDQLVHIKDLRYVIIYSFDYLFSVSSASLLVCLYDWLTHHMMVVISFQTKKLL